MRIFFGATLSVILLSVNFLWAQSYSESALLFSRTQPAGSARILGLGGTQTALGGDYSSALSNPAGLGMYNRSEFTFSPALSFYDTKSEFNGTSTDESTSKFNIPGISYVMHMGRDDDERSFRGGSLGISFSRINDFNRSTIYRGRNTTNSIVDYFMEQANGDTPSQFDSYQYNTPTGLAFYNYLIGPQSITDPNNPDDQYFTDAPVESDQQEEIITKGTSYQWNFSYGANIEDKFFFGGGLGISTLRYKSQKTFSESYLDTDIIESMQLNENLSVRGSGVNVTLGAIVRPVDFIQIGASFTSPTYYQITENYDASMSTSWNNYDYWDGSQNVTLNDESASTDIVTSEYNLTTPLKISAGIAFISKYGFITADIERTNPAKARYSSDISGISFSSENDEIKSLYRATNNYRIGAEFRYEIFRLRAGYNIQSSSFENEDLDNKITTISGGVGVRLKKFYADFALINRSFDNFYSPYTLNDGSEPVVKMENKTLTSMLTFGFTF
ncbi:OmpP1/FadL family transporter [Ohtaekwangia kribbensis]|uniref:OmpP1/FadL family transporter n=2 Tax=Ohtaekwangia kribbensis TaxID=688913 RepID=A0ABW3K508_9BACT